MQVAFCWGLTPLSQLSRHSQQDPSCRPAVNLLLLPDEVIVLIASELQPGDLFRLAQCCRSARKIVSAAAPAWIRSLSRVYSVPKDLNKQLLQPLPVDTTWRDVCLGLRLIQPAAQSYLGAQLSQGTCVASSTSQFPQVLHLNGTAQRTLHVAFPQLPAARYAVVWHMKAARAFQRGYISYNLVFMPGKHHTPTTAVPTLLRKSRTSLRSISTAAGRPNAAIVPDDLDAAVPGDLPADIMAIAPGPDVDAAEGAAVRGPPLPQLSWLAALRSRMLGSYSSHWQLVDRATIRENSRSNSATDLNDHASGRTASGGTVQAAAQPGLAEQQAAADMVLAPGSAEAVRHDTADKGADDGGSEEWGDVVVGEVTLRRTCAPRFVFAVLQVARMSQATPRNAQGGVYVDYVQLKPLENGHGR